MANVGERFRVGTPAPETGRYKHTSCDNTEIFNKGNTLAPCAKVSCPSKGTEWILQQKLT
jgi:hypothetical protein